MSFKPVRVRSNIDIKPPHGNTQIPDDCRVPPEA
jgi:hypothetical protein